MVRIGVREYDFFRPLGKGDWRLVERTITSYVFSWSFNSCGSSFLRIPFALPLALLAGIFEIVPIIGPLIAAVPAIIIGVNVSYLTGLFVVVLYILVQQLENYLLAPKIMQKSTGISPVTIIVSLAVGTKLAGFWGALLAIPVFLTIRMFLRVFLLR